MVGLPAKMILKSSWPTMAMSPMDVTLHRSRRLLNVSMTSCIRCPNSSTNTMEPSSRACATSAFTGTMEPWISRCPAISDVTSRP